MKRISSIFKAKGTNENTLPFGSDECGKFLRDTYKEIFIINWIKHNSLNSPKVKKCIEKELTTIKNKEFIKIFYRVCKQYQYSIDTVCIDYGEEEEKEQQEKEKKNCKNNEDKKQVEDKYQNNSVVVEYIKVYENYIEPVNKYTEEWILTVSKTIDIDLFKRAVNIAIYI